MLCVRWYKKQQHSAEQNVLIYAQHEHRSNDFPKINTNPLTNEAHMMIVHHNNIEQMTNAGYYYIVLCHIHLF